MKKLAVIVLHGIGTHHDHAEDEVKRFDRRLQVGIEKRLGAQARQVHWQGVLWSSATLEKRQRAVRQERKPPLFWKGLFEFVTANLCDATAYNLPKAGSDRDCAYFEIQRMVRNTLAKIEAALGGPDAAARIPVLAIAQSMGCHVLSCYAWDANREPDRVLDDGEAESGLTDFQRLRTLAGLAYLGCNLPLLTMDVPRDWLLPIKLPKHPLPGSDFEASWLNFYEGSDPLGYPLEKEYATYFDGKHPHAGRFEEWERDPALETRPSDIEVKRRTLLGLTPYAHRLYDRMPRVLDSIAGEIRRLLDAST